MTLLERLEGSYLVQEQEAAAYIRELQGVLNIIKVSISRVDFIEMIDKVLEQKDVDQ
jgi:hypothetical protein